MRESELPEVSIERHENATLSRGLCHHGLVIDPTPHDRYVDSGSTQQRDGVPEDVLVHQQPDQVGARVGSEDCLPSTSAA